MYLYMRANGTRTQNGNPFNQGFTLLELLVVILIIGILVAFAALNYQQVVEKVKARNGLALLKAVHDAGVVHFMANGRVPQNFDELSVGVPWTGHEKGNEQDTDCLDVRSNGDWSLQLQANNHNSSVFITRLKGKYRGGGFIIRWRTDAPDQIPISTLMCTEMEQGGADFTAEPGSFCSDMFDGTYKTGSDVRYYSLP